MRKTIRINILLLSMCIMLCGCTRREQLVLKEVSEEQSLTGQQILQEDKTEEQNAAKQQSTGEQNAPAENAEPQTIYVHVCGAVINPNVYELPTGSRVYEAVQMAGGFTEDADGSYVNQAQTLSDGVKLVIPTIEQTQAMITENVEVDLIGIVGEQGNSASMQGGAASSDGKININTATEAELCNIPGIGATRAAAIVAYRQEKGGFSAIEDIMNVSGIKEGTYEKIKDSIKVN
ncbi:MAG: helix-hairpin-helix domain-containing protein [Lachnospiraceae bacterium]|nr:helix-hairpin-helix domain-containing protein [Lachnospiraceae bacterium]